MSGEHSAKGQDSTGHTIGSHHPVFFDLGGSVETSSVVSGTLQGRRTGVAVLTPNASGRLHITVLIGKFCEEDRDRILKWAEEANKKCTVQVGDGEQILPLRSAGQLKAGPGDLYVPGSLGAGVKAWLYIRLEHAQQLRFPEVLGDAPQGSLLETLAVIASILCLQSVPGSLQPSGTSAPMIGSCPKMSAVFERIASVGDSSASVLIYGETGTGKELVARCLHTASSRRAGPFVALNCAGLRGETLRSELFGHTRGSFTGAHRSACGKFVEAHGGTIFLDEIGDMPLETQKLLLRTLEERRVAVVGGKDLPFDARLVCATNKDLTELVRAGAFGKDFFHRISTVELTLPPLRERGDDISRLADSFLETLGTREKRTTHGLTNDAYRALRSYAWPGNVRELQHAVHRGLLNAAPGAAVCAHDLELPLQDEQQETCSSDDAPQLLASPPAVSTLTNQQLLRFLRPFIERLERVCFGDTAESTRAAVEQALRPSARIGRACVWISVIRPKLRLAPRARGNLKNALNAHEAAAFAELILRGAAGDRSIEALACSAALELRGSDHGVHELVERVRAPAAVRTNPPHSGIRGPVSLDEKEELT